MDNDNYCRCDRSEYRQIETVIRYVKPDLVYTCAAEFGRWNGEHFYEKVWKTNAVGTKNIIRLQEELGFKLVHTSTSEVYGDYQDVMYEDVIDNVAIHQMNDYAMSKRVMATQIDSYVKEHNKNWSYLIPCNLYGEYDKYEEHHSHFVSALIK